MDYKLVTALTGSLLAFSAYAGPENIKFPSDYLKGVLYQTLDRPDTSNIASSTRRPTWSRRCARAGRFPAAR